MAETKKKKEATKTPKTEKALLKVICTYNNKGAYKMREDGIMTCIQTDNYENDLCNLKLKDSEPELSEMSRMWGGVETIYYVWKHVKSTKYKGQFNQNLQLPYYRFDFEDVMKDKKAFCGFIEVRSGTIEREYVFKHIPQVYETLKKIIFTNYPEYIDSWKKFVAENKYLLYGGGFIMETKEYNKFAKWLFEILGKVQEELSLKTMTDVDNFVYTNDKGINNSPIMKYLEEILQTLYFFHNFGSNICLTDYDKIGS